MSLVRKPRDVTKMSPSLFLKVKSLRHVMEGGCRLFLPIMMTLLGIGSWIGVNGIYAELPFMIGSLPEKYSIAASLSIAIQVGNIGPLAYLGLRSRCDNRINPTIVIILIIGILCCGLLACFWDTTITLESGRRASGPLLILGAGLAVLDCTSSLLFWPFAAHFPSSYITAMAFGEALSSTVPGVLSWIQAVGRGGICAKGEGALFSPSVYFGILGGILLASLLSFRVLVRHVPNQARSAERASTSIVGQSYRKLLELEIDSKSEFEKTKSPTVARRILEISGNVRSDEIMYSESRGPGMSKGIYFAIGILGLLENGVLPSILPLASMLFTRCTYGAANSTALAVSPFFALLVLFLPLYSQSLALCLTLLSLLLTGYIFAVAIMQDKAILAGSVSGAWLHGILIVVAKSLIAYTKSAAFWLVREGHETGQGDNKHEIILTRNRLQLAGVATQVGSLVGALGVYFMVQYSNWFADS